ncbi:hypothetical protein P8452_65314 [Trifolium repens]|nr:hypothetical protein P8452_65314 [Trifolium repens]
MSIAATINAEYDEAEYMSDLLQALKPTPMGWSNKTHHCKWKGISCNSTTQAVTSIMLPSSSLTGTLPPNITTLTNLTHIDLHNNSLNGSLPIFNSLSLLQTISLGHNNFTFYPDDCIIYLPDLRIFNLSNNLNLYDWEFPMDDLSGSKYLETLDLEATNMFRSLPSDMFENSFSNLHTFIISHNKMYGALPQSLGKSAVRYLRLNNQKYKFSDTIDFISSMSNLSQVWLHNNSFTGRIPNMSNCTNLSDLQLQSNLLTGLIPPSLLALPSLSIISLGDNMLQGRMPVFHKGVKATLEPNSFCRSDGGPCDPQIMILLEIFEALRSSFFYQSPVTGNDACTLPPMGYGRLMIRCQREKIASFEIRNFELTGTISPAFSNLTSLVNLTLAGNYLNGSIPDRLKNLPQLKLLDVSNNNLSGVIPIFSPKVKLNVTGNAFLVPNVTGNAFLVPNVTGSAFLVPNMSKQGGYENASKANLRHVIWITGTSMIIVGVVILIVLIICKRKRKDSIVSMIGTRGTIGYIAPEVFSRTYGGVSHKSDVYSYDWIYKDLEQGNNLENCLANSDEENDMVRQITMVSLWCIQINPSDRPSMSKVLDMLQGPLQLVPYPPKPFLHSPKGPSLQTSFVSSSNLLETNSTETQVKM